jgi:N-acetylmuramoyl-L-alanine amidase
MSPSPRLTSSGPSRAPRSAPLWASLGRVVLGQATLGILALALALAGVSGFSAHAFTVVLDPGHGGTDFGTIHDDGKLHLAEKEVTLALAHETSSELRAAGVKVHLTRTEDRVVDLPSRTALANRLKADVFVSLHLNSTTTPMVNDAEGIETYILNNTNDGSSRRLARLENGVLGGHEKETENEPLDVALILKDMRLDANLPESKRLACTIQTELVRTASRLQKVSYASKSRGVKQALFHVLLGADMPSVLVEVGFLSNARDRALVLRPETRKSLGKALAQALLRFHQHRGTPAARRTLSTCQVREQG